MKQHIHDYLAQADWRVRENSNTGWSNQGMMSSLAQQAIAEYWLDELYPADVAAAHRRGDFHLHDNGHLTGYCAGFDLLDLLTRGFGGVTHKVQSGPPKHLSSALGQACNFMYTVAGEIAGAVAFSNFDTLLAPFIRYDNLSYRQVRQALQEFIFNINVPTRTGFQSPFTNLTFDLRVPRQFAEQPVIIGGVQRGETYSEFQMEMDMLNRAFAEVMAEGDAAGRVFTFPIPTYNITREFDWNDPTFDPIWKMTGRFGIPYFANYIQSDMRPEDATSMCCRLRIDRRELQKRHGGLFASAPLTGSIGVVTLNLPRAAYQAHGDVGVFRAQLAGLSELAAEALRVRRETVEELTESGFYPYLRYYLGGVKERFGAYWANHFNTIGLVGMNEACRNLLGVTIRDPRGKRLAVETLELLRDIAAGLQANTGGLYNIEATPAESTGYRLARLDVAEYPDIVTAGNVETPYYSNSTYIAASDRVPMFDELDHQEELQTRYTGGTVVHVRLGEGVEDPAQVKLLVKTIAQGWRVPYFSITPVFSVCPIHGHLRGRHVTCPRCGGPADVYDRVVGYLQPISQWNDGKQSEELARTAAGRNESYAL